MGYLAITGLELGLLLNFKYARLDWNASPDQTLESHPRLIRAHPRHPPLKSFCLFPKFFSRTNTDRNFDRGWARITRIKTDDHRAQIMGYGAITGLELGLLLNFKYARLDLETHRPIKPLNHIPALSAPIRAIRG